MSGPIKPAALLTAYMQVGRNLEDIQKYGRILTSGERREVARLEGLVEDAFKVGSAHAEAGGKMKHNPHAGDSLEWWGWHEGYKATKKLQEDAKRRAARSAA
jgi:hypothetical protein